MGTENRHNESMSDESEQAFSKEEDVIQLLRFIFRHGYSDLPSVILPDKSAEERESAIQSLHEQARTNVVDKPTVVDWLQSGLFTDENSNVSLAMLFIEWYEQHSPMSRTQANGECNFRYSISNITDPCNLITLYSNIILKCSYRVLKFLSSLILYLTQ